MAAVTGNALVSGRIVGNADQGAHGQVAGSMPMRVIDRGPDLSEWSCQCSVRVLYLVVADAKDSGDVRSGAGVGARVPGPAREHDVRFASAQARQAACGVPRYTSVRRTRVACRPHRF